MSNAQRTWSENWIVSINFWSDKKSDISIRQFVQDKKSDCLCQLQFDGKIREKQSNNGISPAIVHVITAK